MPADQALTYDAPDRLLRDIVRACYHYGGLRTARLLRLSPDFFAALRREILDFVEAHKPSDVRGAEHVTNWTKPFGAVYQFSLLNRSGRVDDTSSDHDLSLAGKSFHHRADYPHLAELTIEHVLQPGYDYGNEYEFGLDRFTAMHAAKSNLVGKL